MITIFESKYMYPIRTISKAAYDAFTKAVDAAGLRVKENDLPYITVFSNSMLYSPLYREFLDAAMFHTVDKLAEKHPEVAGDYTLETVCKYRDIATEYCVLFKDEVEKIDKFVGKHAHGNNHVVVRPVKNKSFPDGICLYRQDRENLSEYVPESIEYLAKYGCSYAISEAVESNDYALAEELLKTHIRYREDIVYKTCKAVHQSRPIPSTTLFPNVEMGQSMCAGFFLPYIRDEKYLKMLKPYLAEFVKRIAERASKENDYAVLARTYTMYKMACINVLLEDAEVLKYIISLPLSLKREKNFLMRCSRNSINEMRFARMLVLVYAYSGYDKIVAGNIFNAYGNIKPTIFRNIYAYMIGTGYTKKPNAVEKTLDIMKFCVPNGIDLQKFLSDRECFRAIMETAAKGYPALINTASAMDNTAVKWWYHWLCGSYIGEKNSPLSLFCYSADKPEFRFITDVMKNVSPVMLEPDDAKKFFISMNELFDDLVRVFIRSQDDNKKRVIEKVRSIITPDSAYACDKFSKVYLKNYMLGVITQ